MFVTLVPLVFHQIVLPLSKFICPCGYQTAEGIFSFRTYDMPGYVAMNEFNVICRGDLGGILIEVWIFLLVLFSLFMIYGLIVVLLGKFINKIYGKSAIYPFRKIILFIFLAAIIYILSVDPWVTPAIGRIINKKIHDNNTHSLVEATRQGKMEIVKEILDHGGDIFAKAKNGQTAAAIALDFQLTEIIKLFKENLTEKSPALAELWIRGIEPTRNGLIKAIREQDIEIVRLLIELKISADTDNSECPLCVAARLSDQEMIDLLIRNVADVNKRDLYSGFTPLIYASIAGKANNVMMLIKYGAKIDYKTNEKWTALLKAVSSGVHKKDRPEYPDIIKTLLENGANINMQNENGMTSLMFAAEYGNIEMVRLLLTYGPNLNLNEYKYGYTSIRLAKKNNHEKIVEILRQAGARE